MELVIGEAQACLVAGSVSFLDLQECFFLTPTLCKLCLVILGVLQLF